MPASSVRLALLIALRATDFLLQVFQVHVPSMASYASRLKAVRWRAALPVVSSIQLEDLPMPMYEGGAGAEFIVDAVRRRDNSPVQDRAPAMVPISEDGTPLGSSDSPVIGAGLALVVSQTFNRPADTSAYASGDLVANSTTAGSVAAMSFAAARVAGGTGMIRRVRVRKSNTSLTNASFRVHLYRAAPATIINGDNGAWSTSGVADYMGSVDVVMDRAFTDGAWGIGLPTGPEINFDLTSGLNVFGLVEARGAYTPASGETFGVDLEVLQN